MTSLASRHFAATCNSSSSDTDCNYLRLPSLWVKGHYFYCDGEALSLTNAGRKLDLITAFLSTDGYKLSREQIFSAVYGQNSLHLRSERFQDCLNMSMLRTISDTRKRICATFSHRFPGIDWMPFNHREKRWKLLRFQEDYVLAQIYAQAF